MRPVRPRSTRAFPFRIALVLALGGAGTAALTAPPRALAQAPTPTPTPATVPAPGEPGSMREQARKPRLPAASAPRAVPRYDVERYLNIRGATQPEWSARGTSLAFLTGTTGQAQVWRMGRAGAWPEQVTSGLEPVEGFAWSPVDDDVLIFRRSVGGNERTQFFLANVATGEVRRLTGRDDVIHNWGGWSRDGTRLVYSANARNQAYFDVYVLDLRTGAEQLVLQKDATLYPQGFSPDGRYVLVLEAISNFDGNLWLVDLAGGGEPVLLTPHAGAARYESPRWAADSSGFFLRSDEGRDFLNLAWYDLKARQLAFREDRSWDVEELEASADGRLLALAVNVDGAQELELKDLRLRSATQVRPGPTLPAGMVQHPAFTQDGRRLAFTFQGPATPPEIRVYDLAARTLATWTKPFTAGIPPATFVASTLEHYRTFDGRTLSGWLYRPAGATGPIPVIVNVHGGPEDQSQAVFSALSQYFVQRGFGVFYPNVRGSTGYGKAFSHLDDVDKRLDSVRDLAETARWLESSGIAQPGRVAVTGGSYGGYMTLAALAFHPDLWACGVSTVGISNLRTFIANTGAWRRALRAAEYGDPDKDGAAMDAASPLHQADRITAPLMVIQGANDPRVPQSESDQIVDAVRKRGGTVEYLLFPDEGHGLAKLPNRIKAYTQMADFMERYLLPPAPPPKAPPAGGAGR